MAWAFVSAGAWDRGEGSSLSLAPGAPSGSGGVLLLLASQRIGGTITGPSGWTTIANVSRNAIFARVSDGGGDDTPTVSVTSGGAAAAIITRWTGGNTTLGSLLNGTVATRYGAAPGGINLPAVTPSVNNCLVLRGGHCVDDAGPYSTVPSGDTFLAENDYDNTSNDMWSAWCYRVQTTAATVATGEIDNGSASADTYAIGVALTEGVTTTKYVKILTDSSAASATGVEVVVHSAPGGSNYITGTTRYGSVNAQEFEASLESGSAVLKVLASDVGCNGLAAATTVAALARNTTYTTGMVEATIIEE
jgi:hypothetical protein